MKRVCSQAGLTVGERQAGRWGIVWCSSFTSHNKTEEKQTEIIVKQWQREKWRERARETMSHAKRERVQEGEGTGCLWGHLPNLCFQHFLPTLIFQLCSTLITSIHMWEYVGMFVNVCASHSVCWFCMDPHVTATLVIATQTVWKHAHKLLFLYINHSILQRNNWGLVNIPCNLSSWSEGKNSKDKILSRYTKCVTSSYHLWTSASPYHGTVDLCKQNKTNS